MDTQKILRWLELRGWWRAEEYDPDYWDAEGLRRPVLLDIAIRIQYSRDMKEERRLIWGRDGNWTNLYEFRKTIGTRCEAPYSGGGYPCEHHLAHGGQHRTAQGET